MLPAPLISVIVVCRNPGPRLQETLASIWGQTKRVFELVVIDGASTDGTVEWLQSIQTRIDHLVVAPDGGIYDAMNRGIAAARGSWVIFIGADDRLAHPAVLAEAVELLRETAADVLVGEAVYEDGRRYRLAARPRPQRRNFVHHQAAFFRRGLFAEFGGYDPGLTIAGDYDFNLRLWRAGRTFARLAMRITFCGTSGVSDAGRWPTYGEEIRVRHRHFPAWQCWSWDFGSMLRYVRKQIIRRFGQYG